MMISKEEQILKGYLETEKVMDKVVSYMVDVWANDKDNGSIDCFEIAIEMYNKTIAPKVVVFNSKQRDRIYNKYYKEIHEHAMYELLGIVHDKLHDMNHTYSGIDTDDIFNMLAMHFKNCL